MKAAVQIPLVIVLTCVNVFFNHCVDCRSKDGKESKSFMETERRSSAKITCGRRLTTPAPAKKSYNGFREDKDKDNIFPDSQITPRISGGRNEVYGEVPWHANLIAEKGNGDIKYTCGAAIISEFWLVTAASCFSQRFVESLTYYVFVGDHTTQPQDGAEGLYEIRGFFIHKSFTETQKIENDIALVFIQAENKNSGIKFNKFVQPACLPLDTEYLSAELNLTVSGIGSTGNDSDESQIRMLKVMTGTPEKCIHGNYDYPIKKVFCLNNTGDALVCVGDSGGPVVRKNDGVFVLYGVLAYADMHGCLNYRPAFAMNILGYRGWITDTIARISHGREAFIPGRT